MALSARPMQGAVAHSAGAQLQKLPQPMLPRPFVPRRTHMRCRASDSWTAAVQPLQSRAAVSPVAASTSAAAVAAPRPTTRSARDLKDPLHIGSTNNASLPVVDRPGELSLEQYMRLPIEQYFVLDPEKIRFLGGNRFGLSVPRLELLGTWIEPKLEVTVLQEEDAVVLIADNCHIKGSALINSLKLDEHFCMQFTTRLTWDRSSASLSSSNGSSNGSITSASSIPSTSFGNGASSSQATAPERTALQRLDFLNTGIFGGKAPAPAAAAPGSKLHGHAKLDVWCEVIPPFNLMPRPALAASCNAVMNGLLNTLLPLFVKQLAADYGRWSTDAAYRTERAARKKPLGQ